jgi:mRNA (guanine-N7-)-methyltransferase
MTDAEIKMYKTYIGKGTARLAKRKRGASSEPDPYDQPPLKRSTNDEGIVAQHCKEKSSSSFMSMNSSFSLLLPDNSRPEVGIAQRQDSPIIGLKNFNNWVKSVLITSFAHPVLAQSAIGQGRSRGRVLDMGCGKGGDIIKWSKAKIYEYVGAGMSPQACRLHES